MNLKFFLKTTLPIAILSISTFWLYAINTTKGFLLNKYIDTPDVFNLFNPIDIFNTVGAMPTLTAIIILCTVLVLLITREANRFATHYVALPLIIFSVPCWYVYAWGDWQQTFGNIFFATISLYTLLVILPILIVGIVAKYLDSKNINIYPYLLIAITLAVPIYTFSYNYKINTCSSGSNIKCQIRNQIKKLDVSACNSSSLKDFEKNQCYEIIASQTHERELCLNIKNDNNSFWGSITRCINTTYYTPESNKKIFEYISTFLTSCEYFGDLECKYEKSSPLEFRRTNMYKICFQNTNEKETVNCLKKIDFEYVASLMIKALENSLPK